MRLRETFNPKRKIQTSKDEARLSDLAKAVKYGGNPEHKRNPGDFGLTPPAQPRADKTLCDKAGIFKRDLARRLLREGVEKGLISERMKGAYPQNIWSVRDGCALEAQLENPEQGLYHGYPMPANDPLREAILKRWNEE